MVLKSSKGEKTADAAKKIQMRVWATRKRNRIVIGVQCLQLVVSTIGGSRHLWFSALVVFTLVVLAVRGQLWCHSGKPLPNANGYLQYCSKQMSIWERHQSKVTCQGTPISPLSVEHDNSIVGYGRNINSNAVVQLNAPHGSLFTSSNIQVFWCRGA